MAFVKIAKQRPGFSGVSVNAVTMGTYLADGKKHKTKSVMFRITYGLIDQLGWKYDEEGSLYLMVHEGNGPDAGFLQIVQVEQSITARKISKGKEGHNQGVSLSIAASSMKHYVLNECPVSAAEVIHMVDGDALLIQCPDWLRYNPESYQEPEPAKVEVKKEPRRPPTLSVVLVDKETDEEIIPNRHQRRKITKRLAQALRT